MLQMKILLKITDKLWKRDKHSIEKKSKKNKCDTHEFLKIFLLSSETSWVTFCH